MHNKHWGLCAVIVDVIDQRIYKMCAINFFDMYPTVISAACFYLIYSGDKENKPHARKVGSSLIITGVCFSWAYWFSDSCRRHLFLLFFRQKLIKNYFYQWLDCVLLLCACTALLLALAYHTGGDSFMRDVLRMEILGRMDNHFLPRYFYFTNSLVSYALAYPLAWLVLGGTVYYAYTRRDNSHYKKLLLQLFGWMMVIMIGMSIPDDKKVRYILPMLPAIALIAAYPFVAPPSQPYFTFLRHFLRRLLQVFPLLLLFITITLSVY